MSKSDSTYRRAADSTFNPERLSRAAGVAERVLDEWRRTGVADLPAAVAKSPCLLDNRSVFLNLVQNEFRERSESGEGSSPEEYCRRFPGLDQRLLKSVYRLIETEQFLGDNPDLLKLLGAPHWPVPGEVFEGFNLVEELGRGAVSRVFLARQTDLGDRQVVLKVTQGPRGEAATLGKLRHPNIVPVHSTGEEPATGIGWICMPLLGRYTLAEALSYAFAAGAPESSTDLIIPLGKAVPNAAVSRLREAYEDGVVRIAAQVADALAYVHHRGLLHGDLKPSNVLLTDDGVPMLIDFNLARDVRAKSDLIGGTLPYMAPEQLRAAKAASAGVGNQATTASEVFSFGVLLYQMLTGRLPFIAEGNDNSVKRVASGLLEAQMQRAPDFDAGLSGSDPRLNRLVQKCLQLEPADRLADCEQAAKVLHSLQSRRSRMLRLVHRRPRMTFAVMVSALVIASVSMAGFDQVTQSRTLARAERLADSQDYAAAAKLLRTYVESRPSQLGARRTLAKSLLKLGDYESAAGHYMHAWREGDQPLDVAMVGYCSNLCGDYERAIRAYLDAQQRGFSNAAIENNCAASLLKRLSRHYNADNSSMVESLLLAAYRREPNNRTICFNMLHHYRMFSGWTEKKLPEYPAGIAAGHSDIESCRRAVEFLVARESSIDEMIKYGLPNLRQMVSFSGVESLSEQLTPEALTTCRGIPGFADLNTVSPAVASPAPPVLLDPSAPSLDP